MMKPKILNQSQHDEKNALISQILTKTCVTLKKKSQNQDNHY